MHAQLVEAHKRLEIAKTHYLDALRHLEGQYVKAVVGAGDPVDADAVAQLRASYGVSAPVVDQK